MRPLSLCLACYLGLAVTPAEAPPDGHRPGSDDFSLCGEVIDAMEGGPVVVKVTLLYRGAEEVKIRLSTVSHNAAVVVPSKWEFHLVVQAVMGTSRATRTLRPGDTLSEVFRLHHRYSNIEPGKITLRVAWPIHGPCPDGTLIASPALDLAVEIPPATPTRVAALCRRMEARFHDRATSEFDNQNMARDIITTHHSGLAPLAWQMIERPNATYDVAGLIDFVAERADSPDEVDSRLVQLVNDPNWDEKWAVYRFWKGRGTDLSPVVWQSLTAASLWTRAFTYVTFPRRCGKEWKDALLQDLRDQSKPLASDQFHHLLADLDDDDFDIREKASGRLARLGERVEGELRTALVRPLSAEARRRVAAALEIIKKAKQPPDCVQALEYLSAHDAPENGELLQVLAEGTPDAWLTQQAKAKLAEWRKARSSSDK